MAGRPAAILDIRRHLQALARITYLGSRIATVRACVNDAIISTSSAAVAMR